MALVHGLINEIYNKIESLTHWLRNVVTVNVMSFSNW